MHGNAARFRSSRTIGTSIVGPASKVPPSQPSRRFVRLARAAYILPYQYRSSMVTRPDSRRVFRIFKTPWAHHNKLGLLGTSTTKPWRTRCSFHFYLCLYLHLQRSDFLICNIMNTPRGNLARILGPSTTFVTPCTTGHHVYMKGVGRPRCSLLRRSSAVIAYPPSAVDAVRCLFPHVGHPPCTRLTYYPS